MNPPKLTKAFRDKKWKEAIELLNDIVRIKLAPSPIHGIGVFALRDLKKGDKLYADVIPNAFDLPLRKFKRLKPEIRELILNHWPNIVNGAHFLYPVTKMTAFMNHGEANYDINSDEVLKPIKCGEEIFVDYKKFANSENIFKWMK